MAVAQVGAAALLQAPKACLVPVAPALSVSTTRVIGVALLLAGVASIKLI